MSTSSTNFPEQEQREGTSVAMKAAASNDALSQSFVLSFLLVIDGYVLGNLGDIQLGGHPEIRY